uniref:5-formyltetrahydrofolate cyclo-ligase n=1 Tax=Arcella intermedia TaxID=1963864 RepID=A0A6B2LK59_9EUKA
MRKDMKERLSQVTPSSIESQGADIQRKVLSSNQYQNSKHIAVYLHTKLEVPTLEIIKNIFDSGKYCYVLIQFYRIYNLSDLNSLPTNRWNIKEPDLDRPRENPLESGLLDLMIIPGLGFDLNRYRLGKGKGYYDRFINQFSAKHHKPYLMAVCLLEQLVPQIPTEPHDVQMDQVITTQSNLFV